MNQAGNQPGQELLDPEWVHLLSLAKDSGVSFEEIKYFFAVTTEAKDSQPSNKLIGIKL